eukprot:1158250-Pelagomonas_calceolata.AAC.4
MHSAVCPAGCHDTKLLSGDLEQRTQRSFDAALYRGYLWLGLCVYVRACLAGYWDQAVCLGNTHTHTQLVPPHQFAQQLNIKPPLYARPPPCTPAAESQSSWCRHRPPACGRRSVRG